MATAQPDPPLAADELVAAGTEREVLEAFLDFHREVLVRKVGHADILREQTDGAAGVDG
jgi:hypothetical protein